MAQININCRTEAPCVLCDVVAKDDAPHGTLARSRFPHQQHLLLLQLPNLRIGSRCTCVLHRCLVHPEMRSSQRVRRLEWELYAGFTTAGNCVEVLDDGLVGGVQMCRCGCLMELHFRGRSAEGLRSDANRSSSKLSSEHCTPVLQGVSLCHLHVSFE
jgi:hypothetical protein